jgi:transcriptional regulator PpsR
MSKKVSKKSTREHRGFTPGFRVGDEQLMDMLKQTSDWLIVVNRDGTVLSIEHDSNIKPAANVTQWLNQSFLESVTIESKPKIEALLSHDTAELSRWRQVNHPIADEPDLPVRYSACKLDAKHLMLVGQSMGELAQIQQRMMRSQHALETDFARVSQAKVRYQLLFDLSAEALLNIDMRTLKIVDANPAAQRLLGRYIAPLKNNRFPTGFDEDSTDALNTLLKQAQVNGRAEDVAVCTVDNQTSFLASAALVRDRIESVLMVRLSPIGKTARENVETQTTSLFDTVVAKSHDAIVICDWNGQIISANEAFCNMAHLPDTSYAVGKSVDNWLGHSAMDYRLLVNNLKEHGTIPKFTTVVSGEHGTDTDVEISASSIPDPRFPYTLLIMRNVQSRPAALSSEIVVPTAGPPLKELVGRVPLKELVRKSTDLIERMCIESALEMTSDNRASAAEMLGVSRQSLYTKLRRFGIPDQSIGPD